ncbi:MAG: PAS domain-containing protein [Deltaproteobacteria bacterium]|nr:MAG: PAS domain-containing protein [Deltaproteobacteria bacterium]
MHRILERPEFVDILSEALANTTEGITIADCNQPDMPIIYVNRAFSEITGYAREEVLGRNCRFLQGPKTDPEAVRRIQTIIQQGKRGTVELLNYTKAGCLFWNRLALVPVGNARSGPMYYVGIQSDITALKKQRLTEERLRAMRGTLLTVYDIVFNFMNVLTLKHEDWLQQMSEVERQEFEGLYKRTVQRLDHLMSLDRYEEVSIGAGLKALSEQQELFPNKTPS